MAFTSAQKALFRRYLGYPDLWRYKNTRLEGAMDTAGEDADAVVLLLADLEKLVEIDTKIFSSGISGAGVKSVDEIEFFEGGASGSVLTGLRNLGRSVAGRISTTLGVPFYADYFGTGGYPGDGFMGGSGGNLIPLG
jgi:hypothetical protein